MDDLIYKFLIQAGFPRASIVTDVTSVQPAAAQSDASFVIVDPETVDRLAVLSVVGPVNADGLIEQCAVVSNFASTLDGRQTQAFVVRVDNKATREAEQVQFYRCHPNTDLQQLSARTFPDLGSMQVSHKLLADKPIPATEVIELPEAALTDESPTIGLSAYIPACLLVLLAIVDWVMALMFNRELLNDSQTLLLIGAAVLWTLPALLKVTDSR